MRRTIKKIFAAGIALVSFFSLAPNIQSFSISQPINMNAVNDFRIDFTPQNPGANTKTTANIVTYSFDPDVSSYTWTYNGKIIAKGKGQKTAEFTTGDIGTTAVLSVSVVTEKGLSLSKTIKYTVGDFDLLWQAESYTPPYYKSKAKASFGSTIKISAITHGLGNQKNLIYEWRRNFQNAQSASGLGKDTFSFVFPMTSFQETIRLTVWGPRKEYSLQKTITIKNNQPEIIIYEQNPLEGPKFQKAVTGQFDFAQSETVLRAEPYFFPKSDLNELSYKWTMNGKNMETGEQANIIGLKYPEDKGVGYTNLMLEISNPKQIIQNITQPIKVNLK
jgi:transposase-like protein